MVVVVTDLSSYHVRGHTASAQIVAALKTDRRANQPAYRDSHWWCDIFFVTVIWARNLSSPRDKQQFDGVQMSTGPLSGVVR